MKKAATSIFIAALTFGCAALPQKNEAKKNTDASFQCGGNAQASSHARIAARANSQAFSGCFKNYLKLNPDAKNLSVKFCAHIKTNSQGGVRKASLQDGVFNGGASSFPNDLRWCLEQQLWKLDFSGLQFESPQILSFPLAFEVRK